ncbi:hypothetical protein Tco_0616216 [Tanacetum coccineum]
MTRSSTKELFNILSRILTKNNIAEEEVVKIIAETMEQYLRQRTSKPTRIGSLPRCPKIEDKGINLSYKRGQFLKDLRTCRKSLAKKQTSEDKVFKQILPPALTAKKMREIPTTFSKNWMKTLISSWERF